MGRQPHPFEVVTTEETSRTGSSRRSIYSSPSAEELDVVPGRVTGDRDYLCTRGAVDQMSGCHRGQGMQARTELGHGRFRVVRHEVSLELPQAADRPCRVDSVLEKSETTMGGVECAVEISAGETGCGEASHPDGLVAGGCLVDGGSESVSGAVDLAGAEHDLALSGVQLGFSVPAEPGRQLVAVALTP